MAGTLPNDATNIFKGVLTIQGLGKGFSESFMMKGTSWDAAILQLQYLAKWRAACLARNLWLQYAVVSMVGPSRASKVAIEYPIAGGTAVAPFLNATLRDLQTNTLASGVRLRLENINGIHVVRNFRGVQDAYVNNGAWVTSAGDNIFDLGDYETPVDPLISQPLTDKVYNLTTPPVSPELEKFVTYSQAWKAFIAGVFQFTDYKIYARDSAGKVTGTNGVYPWESVKFRNIGDRAAGRPSLR